MNDFRYAWRGLLRTPGFTAAALLTLSLGIGANTAIFSIVDHVVLRPLTYRDADRLFVVHETVPNFPDAPPLVPVAASHFFEWQRSVNAFEDSAILQSTTLNLTGSGEPQQLSGATTTPGLFRMLGVQPQLGRTFVEQETEPRRDRVVILAGDLWRSRFSGDPRVIGRVITLNGEPHEVVGILPDDFFFPKIDHLYALTISAERPQIWKPLALSAADKQEFFSFNYAGIVRLKPGVTRLQALAELNAAQAAVATTAARKVELGAALVGLQDQMTSRSKSGLQLLLVAAGAVLLICCVNLTNLLLVRGAGRARELAVRSALGADRRRLTRQLLVESLILASVGGVAGIAVAYLSLPTLRAFAPIDVPRLDTAELDLRVMFVSVAASMLTGVIVGVLPSWRAANSDPQDALKSGSKAVTSGRATRGMRSVLVGLEVGLSAACLVVAVLLLHSFVKLLDVDPGFEPNRIVTADVTLPAIRYPTLQRKDLFLTAVLQRVAAVPGVVSVGVTNWLPLTGHGGNNVVTPEGVNAPLPELPTVDMRQVNTEFFETMRIPLTDGRIFDDRDRGRREGRVAVISRLAAARMWPRQSPMGKRFYRGGPGNSPLYEVIGVVGDVRGVSLNEEILPTVYEPYWQRFFDKTSIVIRTAADSLDISSTARKTIHDMDPELPVPVFRAMKSVVLDSVAQRRFQMSLVMVFALVALSLAGVGIYGLVSYSVAQRTSEIGLRMSLGAGPASIRALVLRDGLVPVGAGVVGGLSIAVGAGQLLRGLLFGVTPTDPVALIAVFLSLSTVALVAMYLPARHAMRIRPTEALRYE